jgi:hypothetical protein
VNLKISLASIFLIAIIATVTFGVTYAILTWTGTINWTTQDFTVWDSPTVGNKISSPYTDDWVVTIGEQDAVKFYLQNDGSASITIIVTGETKTGCTATWNNPSGWTIPVGTRVLAELTITITGEGSYSWQFQIS